MNLPQLELAEVFKRYGVKFLATRGKTLSIVQHRAMRAIVECQTSVLGGHRWQCSDCGHERIAYNSCRNRHCPKCQAQARAKWLEARTADLLPVSYFHVVFTLPEQLGPLALQNPRIVYGILFRAAWETLRDVAANPKHLGAKLGALAVLHTWGQNLMHHPHVHCVVPGGGLSPDGLQWIDCRGARKSSSQKKFFLPVRILSRVYRGKFIAQLKLAYQQRKLVFYGRLASLEDPKVFEALLNTATIREWVVYCKPPFGSPEQVLKYLARYTHRVAISNNRLVGIDDGHVSFRWKSYARSSQWSTMSLSSDEFIRRFLMHVLPSGFVRIRHYGLLSNRNRSKQLRRCRQLLAGTESTVPKSPDTDIHSPDATKVQEDNDETLKPSYRCPCCGKQTMQIVEEILPSAIRQRSSSIRPRASPVHTPIATTS